MTLFVVFYISSYSPAAVQCSVFSQSVRAPWSTSDLSRGRFNRFRPVSVLSGSGRFQCPLVLMKFNSTALFSKSGSYPSQLSQVGLGMAGHVICHVIYNNMMKPFSIRNNPIAIQAIHSHIIFTDLLNKLVRVIVSWEPCALQRNAGPWSGNRPTSSPRPGW